MLEYPVVALELGTTAATAEQEQIVLNTNVGFALHYNFSAGAAAEDAPFTRSFDLTLLSVTNTGCTTGMALRVSDASRAGRARRPWVGEGRQRVPHLLAATLGAA